MVSIELLSLDALRVIQAMALGTLETNDCGYICLHCDASSRVTRKDVPELEEIEHLEHCPVNSARLILFQRGTPMNIYKMTHESQYALTKWKASTGHTLAISEEEAIRTWTRDGVRNIQATFVRMFPINNKEDEQGRYIEG